MYFKVSYDDDFDEIMLYLKSRYGLNLFTLDGIGKQLDMNQFSKEFFTNVSTTADVSIDSNANIDTKDIITYNFELPKAFMRYNSYYLLWKKLKQLYGHREANRIIERQIIGDIYINDFNDISKPYCYNFSTYDIMLEGLSMINKIKSVKPKFLYSFKSQIEQFTLIASNSTLGATGLADFLLVMSYYVKQSLETLSDAHFKFKTKDDVWNYIKETLISFIYTVNQPMRSSQSPFTNISIFDDYFIEDLSQYYLFPDGSKPDKEIIKKLQELYIDIMNDELERTPITFPITTACISINENNEPKDTEFVKFIAEKNKKFGFINIYCGKSSTLSSCCRLRSDNSNEYFNSFGSGSTKIGSLGVVTINLPRIAYKNKNSVDEFLYDLEELVIDAGKINNSKRSILKKRIENNSLPLYNLGFMDITKQYSTVGITGLNESCEIMGFDILESDGQNFVLSILNTINKTNDKLQKKYKSPHNCEQVPAENSSIKLAKKDSYMGYKNGEYDIYSNQFIPLTTNADLLDRIKLQGMFDNHFSGGAIAHLNIDNKIEDTQKMVDLINMSAKMGVVYFAVNYNLQYCKNSHMSVGNNSHCSICGEEIVGNYTRVVGFLTNVKNWHKVRRNIDYPKRKWYKEL